MSDGRVTLVRDGAGRLGLQLDDMRPEVLGVYDAALARRGRAGRAEPLLRALGKAKRIVDATAGLGRDTALLLGAGREVTAIERQPLLVELWREVELEGLRFVAGDAAEVMPTLGAVDAVLIDPMFPAGAYRGQVKRASQVLRALEAPDPGGARRLLEVARGIAARVVVKRPRGSAALAPPSRAVDAGVTRLDVYAR